MSNFKRDADKLGRQDSAEQEALDATVSIHLVKLRGNRMFSRKIEASNAAAALNGIAVLIKEFAKLTGLSVVRVLAVLAATMTAPALGEEAKNDEAGARSGGDSV